MSGYRLLGASVVDDHGNGASATGGIETLSRFGLTSITLTSGTMLVSYVTAATSGTLSKLMVASGDAAASGLTLAKIAFFAVATNGDLTRLAVTSTQTGMGGSTFTAYEYAAGPASFSAGGRYAFGLLQVGTTPMHMQGLGVLDGATAPVPAQTVGSQTDILASYTAASLTPTFVLGYVRGRP
jgi:hypothetical protein